MRLKTFTPVLLLFALVFTSGCASKLSSNITPSANVDDLGNIYVVRFEPDGRNLHNIIAEELELLGHTAKSGEIEDKPANTNTVVTYSDRWMWDITMYLLAIDLQVFDVDKGVPIGSIHNMRTSLIRKTPRGMIRGALYEFFDLENPDDLKPQ